MSDTAKANKDHLYYLQHKKEIKDRVKKWAKKNPEKRAAHAHTYYTKHVKETKARKKEWRKMNVETRRKQGVAWKKANPEKVKASLRKSRYGISEEAYQNLFESQNGLCAICKTSPIRDTDHDHINGKVRGLLCRECNLGIGHLKDSSHLLFAAAIYLRHYGN